MGEGKTKKYIIMKLLLLTIFVSASLAEDAKPAAVEPIIPQNYAYSTFSWPGFKDHVYGLSSQCWGCHPIGKRSAEPEADPALYYYPYVHHVPVVPAVYHVPVAPAIAPVAVPATVPVEVPAPVASVPVHIKDAVAIHPDGK